ncbi:hypothetical protein Btru_075971 [Bulinus truncatus]|nr:hypothetical protein Btru_075971 [Bulinus truncatus]
MVVEVGRWDVTHVTDIQPASSRENVVRHFLRLLMHIHHKLLRARLDILIAEITSDKDSAVEILLEKITIFEPSPLPSPEKIDCPLMRVPAPTPAPHRS